MIWNKIPVVHERGWDENFWDNSVSPIRIDI